MPRPIFQYHPAFGYTYIPEIKARILCLDGGYRIRVNNHGFRCAHDFVQQKSDRFRVLLFGDSFTAGDGISNEERYGDQLEQQLPDIEVYNYGIPGTGTDQQYLIYREYSTAIEHDLLILGIMVENIRRIAFRYRLYTSDTGELLAYAKPYYVFQNEALLLKNVPVPKFPFRIEEIPEEERQFIQPDGRLSLLKEFISGEAAEQLATRSTRYPHIREYERADDPSWLLMKAVLQRWIGESPTPVIILPIPYYPFLEGASDPSHYQARFRELASESKCLLHDPLPDFMQYSDEVRRGFRFPIDFHMSAAGHSVLANSLARTVRACLRTT
jgi:lysophospholipase L1-like esterase